MPEADSNLKLFRCNFEVAGFVWDLRRFWKVQSSCLVARQAPSSWSEEREREKRRNLQENNAENRRTQTEMAGVQTRGNTSFTVAECCRPMRPFYKRVKSQQAGKLCFFPVLFLAVGEKAKHTHTHTYTCTWPHIHNYTPTLVQHLISMFMEKY